MQRLKALKKLTARWGRIDREREEQRKKFADLRIEIKALLKERTGK